MKEQKETHRNVGSPVFPSVEGSGKITLALAFAFFMSIVDEILNRALELSQPERAALAHRLLLSLEPQDFDQDCEEAWQAELEVRLAMAERGEADAGDRRDALARMRENLSAGAGKGPATFSIARENPRPDQPPPSSYKEKAFSSGDLSAWPGRNFTAPYDSFADCWRPRT